ncbi:major facilitator superfamily domain-containing protein [Tricladium varicosporioides]|nr:major facilitator superfamily domain-containing protein [Hymenoscyphus varicosporioides]
MPPYQADGGRRAWAFLFGASIVEGLMWGKSFYFSSYYETHGPFKGEKHLQLVGTLTTGVSYLGTPFVAFLLLKFQKYQRQMIFAGWLICISALLASSFATRFWHLAVSQGILYGFGFLFIEYPILDMLNEWFVKRRGMAYGILSGSGGAFGLALPFIIQTLLVRYGHAVTLRVCAIAMFVIVGSILPLIKGRLRPKAIDAVDRKFDRSVLLKATFLTITFSNVFQSLGFFLPSSYLPSYATDIGLSTIQGAFVLSFLNLTQIIGQMGMGHISDHYDARIPMLASTFLSAVVVLLGWGFSKTLETLVTFSASFGLVAGGYSVLYCRFATALTADSTTALLLYSIFEFQRGAASILGSLISGFAVSDRVDVSRYGAEKYEVVILLVGSGMLFSCCGGVSWVISVFRGNQHTFSLLKDDAAIVEEQEELCAA